MVAYASDAAEKAGFTKQLSFHLGDMKDLPFDDDTFDWVWSMDCVGYAPIEPLPIIEELVRVTKPIGRIALLSWSSQQLLPGHLALEAQLNATSVGIAPSSQGKNPDKHFLQALGWLQQLGLEAFNVQTFVRTVHSPLSD